MAEVALLSGSPERVELMAGLLEGAERVGSKRGYTVYTGTHEGRRLTVATSGVGSPSLAIAVEELAACGARTFLRVGSCAAIDEGLAIGDLSIAHAAVRDEGTSAYYAPHIFPAAGSPRVLSALLAAAADLAFPISVGITRSTDSFYEGERKAEVIERWRALGVVTFEMETSALFTIAAALRCEAGSILCVGSNLVTGEATYRGEATDRYREGQDRMLRVALRAARRLVAE